MLRFEVVGSAGDIYQVTAERRGRALVMHCTCQAGQNGTYCKHRISLIEGKPMGVLSGDYAALGALVPGTPVQTAVLALRAAEADVKAAQAKLTKARKNLETAMFGR